MRINDLIVIIGRKRSGKTYLIKNYFLKNLNSYVIDDHTGEYLGYGNTTKDPRMIQYYTKVVYDDQTGTDESFSMMYNFVKNRRKQSPKMKYTMLIIDEAYIHFQKKFLPPAQNNFLRRGRHYGIGGILATQRVYDLHPLVYKQVDYVIFFKTNEPKELKWIEERIQSIAYDKKSHKEINITERIRNLPEHFFVILDMNRNTVSRPLRI